MLKDPVCGMAVEAKSANSHEEYLGVDWYFCSDSCHGEFLANPARYVQHDTMADPVCGMDVSTASRYHMEYDGESWYFCCESCLGMFKREPAHYVKTHST